MAAPSLTCKQQKLFFLSSSFKDEGLKIKRLLQKYPYCDSVVAVVPELVERSVQLNQSQYYYHVEDVLLAKLIDVEFIEAFVKKGSVYLRSRHIHSAVDLCFSIRPPGLLELNVTKDLYEELGLQGSPVSPHQERLSGVTRYVVTIDLTADHFHPGKKGYDRVLWCFKERLDLQSDVNITWIPTDSRICPSSIGTYFTSCGYKCGQGKFRRRVKQVGGVRVPVIVSDRYTDQSDESSCNYEEFYEWLGLVACGCDTEAEVDPFISTYTVPSPHSSGTSLSVVRHQGFHTPENIQRLLQDIRDRLVTLASEDAKDQPNWAALTIHASTQPSELCGLEEVSSISSQIDNNCTIVIFRDSRVWLYSMKPL